MPPAAYVMAKGPIFENISELSRRRHEVDVAQVLGLLRSRQNLVDIGKGLGIVRSARDEAHLREDWFDETHRGWWRHAQPIEPIFRTGLIKAVELVRDLDLPIDAYWVRTDHARSPVRVTLGVSNEQITFLFQSPHPRVRPGVRGPKLVVDRSIWVIERDKKGKVVPKNVKSPALTR